MGRVSGLCFRRLAPGGEVERDIDMCMADGCDPASVYRERVVLARKQHCCCECRRTIEPGEKYQYAFGIWDGGPPSTFHTCGHCMIAQRWLIEECGGWMFGGVEEDIADHIIGAGSVFDATHGYGSGPSRLVVSMRRKWRRFSEEGLMSFPKVPAVSAHTNAA